MKSLAFLLIFVSTLTSIVNATGGCPTPSFRPASTYGAGNEPRSAKIGDFNNDGKSDLAVVNAGSNDPYFVAERCEVFKDAANKLLRVRGER